MPVPQSIDPTEPTHAPLAPSTGLAAMLAPGRVDDIASTFRFQKAPNQRFFLAHHPGDWDAAEVKGEVAGVKLDGVYWLPGITKRELQPGAALIRTRAKNEPPEAAYQHARDVSQRDGWVWFEPTAPLPAECIPPGAAPGSYWREAPCIDPRTAQTGTLHLEVWSVPVPTLPGREQRFQHDAARYNLWRAWLVLTGQVAPPHEYVLDALRNRQAERLARARTMPLPPNALEPRVAAAEARVKLYTDARVPAAPEAAKPAKATK